MTDVHVPKLNKHAPTETPASTGWTQAMYLIPLQDNFDGFAQALATKH